MNPIGAHVALRASVARQKFPMCPGHILESAEPILLVQKQFSS